MLEPDPLWNDALALNGPRSPEVAPFVDAADEAPWPVLDTNRVVSTWVVGLHGGAGASLLTNLLGPAAADAERRWPRYVGWVRPIKPASVVAVARTHYEGIAAARRLARLWASGSLSEYAHLLGIVMIDDGPKLVRDQERAVTRVARMVPHGWHIPWNETWRLAQPSYETVPARVRRIVDNIHSLSSSTNGEQQ
ncbi:hypothetical protein C5C03_00455 [Clavibacter michiganensis]|uniref:DUF6668 family protein n=1 Tax=Clavibacter michiganensis TaxID=28447 RepID=UPI000CE89915|nr:DUF6668 family protein [Clavibacter michiganensis]PPF91329.1 hypothetical protein C5C03_00455 [Clavibacter michiganensis]PPF99371.1 hypothetical protein C5C05_02255 [Clavibacter michiganensis]